MKHKEIKEKTKKDDEYTKSNHLSTVRYKGDYNEIDYQIRQNWID